MRRYTRNQEIEAVVLTVDKVREIEKWCGYRIQIMKDKAHLFLSIQWRDDLIGYHNFGDYMVKNSKGFTVITEKEWAKQDWNEVPDALGEVGE